MPQYRYQAVDRNGEKTTGIMTANNENEVRSQLRTLGVRPIYILKSTPTKPTNSIKNIGLLDLFNGVSGEVVLLFTRQLHVLLNAGIPLVQGLELLTNQLTPISKRMAKTVGTIKTNVGEGKFLWEAMAAYPAIFSKLYVALVRAGENAGQLDETLKRLSGYLESAEKLKKTLKSAMIYPALVITMAIGVIAVMLIFVIPKFEELLKGANQTLPAPTQFLINMSHLIVDHIAAILIVGIVGGFFIIRFFQTDEGKALLQRTFFYAPIFGNILQKGAVARFSRTMQTLLSSGINLLDAIDICQQTIDNVIVEKDIRKIRPEIEKGKTLGEVISRLRSLPLLAIQMISIGETTGALDRMLEKVASYYEVEVEALVAGLAKLIEPALIVFLGGTVGGILVAMYLPIFKLASSVM